MTGIKVEEHDLEEEQNCTLVIASDILLHTRLLQTVINALADGACILAREKVVTESVVSNGFRLETVFEKTLKDEKLLLLRKVTSPFKVLVKKWNPQIHYPIHKILQFVLA
jgi:predicted metal-dependent enzyme (double-stranded beta helix superfamily)